MSKIQDRSKYSFDFPDQLEYEDEIDEMANDFIHGIHADLADRLDRVPTREEVMFEMARRDARRELKEKHDGIDKFLNPRKRRRPVLKKAQAEADKLWSGRKKHVSVREMARILAERGFGSKEHLRKNLKKPT